MDWLKTLLCLLNHTARMSTSNPTTTSEPISHVCAINTAPATAAVTNKTPNTVVTTLDCLRPKSEASNPTMSRGANGYPFATMAGTKFNWVNQYRPNHESRAPRSGQKNNPGESLYSTLTCPSRVVGVTTESVLISAAAVPVHLAKVRYPACVNAA